MKILPLGYNVLDKVIDKSLSRLYNQKFVNWVIQTHLQYRVKERLWYLHCQLFLHPGTQGLVFY